MVAEPDPIPSEKRPLLLYKEQIIEKIDENPEIQTTLETYESMTTLKQNLDIPVSEMMKQFHDGKKRRGQPVEAMTYEQIEASILHSMEALGTKPEDYLVMIQRCLTKKAQQQMEDGESSKHSKPDVKENGNVEEDPNL